MSIASRGTRALANSSVLFGGLQVIFQQADLDPARVVPLGTVVVSAGGVRVAHTQYEDAAYRDLAVEHQIAHDRIRHTQRVGDRGLPGTGGVAAHFDDVVLLIL